MGELEEWSGGIMEWWNDLGFPEYLAGKKV
jgi:hypothetical protein